MAPSHELPRRIVWAYGALGFPLAAAFLALQVFVPTFYAASLGFSLTAVGLWLMLVRLWDVIVDLVVGWASDATPAAWGRRRLWVMAGTPLVALSVWQLFVPPEGAGMMHMLGWATLAYMAGTMVIVPMNAWGAEISADYHQRSRVAGARVTLGLVGALAALIVPAALGYATKATMAETLWIDAVVVIAALVLAVPLALLIVPDRAEVHAPEAPVRAMLTVLARPGPVRRLIGAYLLNGIANALPATLFVLFVAQALEARGSEGLWLVLYFALTAAGVPVWVWLSRRWGKDVAWRAALLAAAALFAWVPFLGPETTALFLVILAGTALACGADLVLPSALQADLIDWDALEHGWRRPGVFYAVWGTATKAAYAFALIAFPILDLAGFSAEGGNSPAALWVLAILYAWVPVALKLAAYGLMRGYPVTREEHARIQALLAERPKSTAPAEQRHAA